jgi:hypothetical protein
MGLRGPLRNNLKRLNRQNHSDAEAPETGDLTQWIKHWLDLQQW